MAQVKLPVRIKVDIRDQFDASDCAVQKAFATVAGIVGLKVQCNVEWDMLFHSLERLFEDKGTFVPSIAEVVVTWCDVLATRLEDENFATWTDDLVAKLSEVGLLKIHLQTADTSRPQTEWSDELRGFLISFPGKTQFNPRNTSSGLESDLQSLFSTHESGSRDDPLPIRNRDDDWAEITEGGETASVSMSHIPQSQSTRPEKMPNVGTLPNIDILMQSTTPYIMFISQKGPGRYVECGSSNVFHAGSGRAMGSGSSTLTEQGAGNIIIQASHGPSLQFLEQYLQRWVKKDHQDTRKVPMLRIKLHESNFGIGMSHDMLTIEPYDTHQERRGIVMNPAIVLLVVENILGYHCVSRFTAGHWEYRRETPFA